jgi:hypothetical protein
MSDHYNHEVIKVLERNYTVISTSTLYDQNTLTKYFKDPQVANFLVEKMICEKGDIFLGTISSTVSAHINYINYINYKPYDHYVNQKYNFDRKMLIRNVVHPETKWTWDKISYHKGHFISWTMFFKDNVYR